MRRKILILLAIVFFGFFMVYILFFKQEFRKTIKLAIPITSLTAQFSNPDNLKKWFSPFEGGGLDTPVIVDSSNQTISSGDYQLKIKNESIYSSSLTFSDGNSKKYFLLSALPDTAKFGGTTLTIKYKDSYFKKWFGHGNLLKKMLASIDNFEEFLNDSKRMYGYEINPVKVTDTSFLFIRKTVPYSERRIATKAIFDNLIAYADKRDAGYNGVRIFYSLKSEDDLTLFASIGITNHIKIPESEPYEYKMMPYGKNLLEATYQGPYAATENVYAALKAYMQDHTLTSMAIPFQKYISDGYDFADDQIVQMKIYYPVF